MSTNGTSLTQYNEALKHIMAAFANIVNDFIYTDLIKILSQKGEKLTQFLRLVIQALLEDREIIIDYSKKIINIDRSKKFDPEKFIGKGWQIEEQDKRSLQISEIDLNEIEFSNSCAR